jgi:uncharacterized protein (TIGR02145 family)
MTVFMCGASKVSYGGKDYNTVLIGNQCWLKENLDIGTMITGNLNQTNNSTLEKYCYNNNSANCATYGGLYQWYEAMQYVTTEGARGICPIGWHIPTYEEYQTLKSTVNNDGNALKSLGQGNGSGTGTNTSGFSCLLAGHRFYDDGTFSSLGGITLIWSTTGNHPLAYALNLVSYDGAISYNGSQRTNGSSVRCIKDN